MVKGKLIFTGIMQASQEYGTDDEHMVSRVYFDIEIEGKPQRGLYVDVKQAVGSSFEGGPIEVSLPKGYKGPISYTTFRDEVERYYRDSFGSSGRAFRFGPGSHVVFRNNLVQMVKVVEFEADDRSEPSGW
jgi:hypothetical protein